MLDCSRNLGVYFSQNFRGIFFPQKFRVCFPRNFRGLFFVPELALKFKEIWRYNAKLEKRPILNGVKKKREVFNQSPKGLNWRIS